MKVYVSNVDRESIISDLSVEVQNVLMDALADYYRASDNRYTEETIKRLCARAQAVSSPSSFENCFDISYLPEKLTFFTFNNLRFQQDGTSPEVKRFENLSDAIAEYNALPKEYTTALGGYLGENSCIDFIHRRNGETVLVTDFKHIEKYATNGLVKQAVAALIADFGIEYESDIRSLGTSCSILVPLCEQEKINSYFQDKYLYPKYSNRLLSAINEVYEEGEGWLKIEDFLEKLDGISPFEETYRPKVTKYNINYVDLKGRRGQADISPADFAFLKEQTISRTAKLPDLDSCIKSASERSTEKETASLHKGDIQREF